MVDALDSKSSGPCARVGSIPTSGTSNINGLGLFGLTRFFIENFKQNIAMPEVGDICGLKKSTCNIRGKEDVSLS